MSFFDATNYRVDIRILNGGQVLLEQADRYFYFSDTDPATHLGAKEAIKWDAVDTDNNPILPSSITIGPDNIVGAVPNQVLNEFLRDGTIDFSAQASISLPSGATFPTFTFSGGEVHSWNYVHYAGITNTNGSGDKVVLGDLDIGDIYFDGNHVYQLQDFLKEIGDALQGHWSDTVSLQSLGETISDFVTSGKIETQITGVGVTNEFYYALIELDENNFEGQAEALYMHSWGDWVKPAYFETADELKAFLLDQNGHAIEGIWDIGVFISDGITSIQDIKDELDPLLGDMSASAQDYLWPNAYSFSNMELWDEFNYVEVVAAYNAIGYDVSNGTYPDGITLDIYNVDTVRLNANANVNSQINNLEFSNNNDITFEVYLGDTQPTTADFSKFTSANAIELHFNGSTPALSLNALDFGANQTVLLVNDVQTTSDVSIALPVAGDALPAKVLVGEGINLNVALDDSNALPDIVNLNEGGTVRFIGTAEGNYIVGTDGADTIEGFGGDDILTGGKGADVFVIKQDSTGTNGGNVTITDFDSNDTISLLQSDGSTAMTETSDKNAATTTAGVYYKEVNSDSDYIMYSFKGGSVYAKDVSDPIYDVPFDFGNDNKFEIYEIPGERYGNIVTFGVRPKGEFIDTDFSQIDFGVTFDTDEFEYFTDSFEIGSQTKAATDASSTKLLEVNDASGAEGRLSFSAGVDGATLPMAYDAHVGWTGIPEDKPDDYVAKFMLKRIDQEPGNNDLQILFADHATWDATNGDVVFDNVTPENFTFNYAKDIVTVKMTNPSGTVAPGSELFVSTATVSDGLSLNPTLQIEDLVKYEVVLNVSVPTVRSSIDLAKSPTNASLKISGAEIFDVSVEADLETSLGTPTMTKNLDDGGVETLSSGTSGEDTFINALSTLGDTRTDLVAPDWTTIDSSESLELSFAGLTEQTTVGRFKVAEFWARQDDSGIQYSYSNDGGTTYSDEITMKAEELSSVGTLRTVVNDGADVALLGNSIYVNPFNSYRAITGYDALQALRISVDDEENPSYSLESFVAADYDFSGTVNASDALGILETAAYVDEDERTTDGSPMWTYIQTNVEGNYVTLGDNGTDITVAHDDDIDQFIGVNTHIEAVAVLKGDTSHSYKYLPEVIDPLFYFLDGFINTGVDVGGTASAASNAGPTTLTYTSGTTKFNISDTDPGGTAGVAIVINANSSSKQNAEDYDVIRVSDNANSNWDNVANVMSGAISEKNATAGDGDTLVFISNGSDARGYMYSDNGTDGVTDAEIQHVYTLSGMTDVTTITNGDFNVPRTFTLYNDTTAPTSSVETYDFGGSTGADHNKLVFDSAAVAQGDTVNNFDRGLDQLVLDVDMSSTTNLSVVGSTSATTAGVESVISSAVSSWTTGTGTLDVLLVSITDQPSGFGSNVKQLVIVDADNSGDYNANSDYNFYVSNYGGMIGANDVSFGFDAAITFM